VILVDANVLLDVLTADASWFEWSSEQLARTGEDARLRINEVCYAELCVRAESQTRLDTALNELTIEIERTPKEALFVAAKAFLRYRTAGGPRLAILPDFFIGAHAQVARCPLLTRDARRFRRYFPKVQLITP